MTKLACLLILAAVGCSAPSINVNQAQATAVTSSEKGTAGKVGDYAKSTPPTGATSMGMMTSPQAGSVTIPITNVEVYTFQANVDDNDGLETLYWAIDGNGVIYVWGQIDLVCVDDNDQPTGETGTADFIYEDDGTDYGWMTATDSCGYSTYYGCSATGGDAEVCGGCDFNDDFIACVAES